MGLLSQPGANPRQQGDQTVNISDQYIGPRSPPNRPTWRWAVPAELMPPTSLPSYIQTLSAFFLKKAVKRHIRLGSWISRLMLIFQPILPNQKANLAESMADRGHATLDHVPDGGFDRRGYEYVRSRQKNRLRAQTRDPRPPKTRPGP